MTEIHNTTAIPAAPLPGALPDIDDNAPSMAPDGGAPKDHVVPPNANGHTIAPISPDSLEKAAVAPWLKTAGKVLTVLAALGLIGFGLAALSGAIPGIEGIHNITKFGEGLASGGFIVLVVGSAIYVKRAYDLHRAPEIKRRNETEVKQIRENAAEEVKQIRKSALKAQRKAAEELQAMKEAVTVLIKQSSVEIAAASDKAATPSAASSSAPVDDDDGIADSTASKLTSSEGSSDSSAISDDDFSPDVVDWLDESPKGADQPSHSAAGRESTGQPASNESAVPPLSPRDNEPDKSGNAYGDIAISGDDEFPGERRIQPSESDDTRPAERNDDAQASKSTPASNIEEDGHERHKVGDEGDNLP